MITTIIQIISTILWYYYYLNYKVCIQLKVSVITFKPKKLSFAGPLQQYFLNNIDTSAPVHQHQYIIIIIKISTSIGIAVPDKQSQTSKTNLGLHTASRGSSRTQQGRDILGDLFIYR
jgi:hypothetical protein